MAEAYHALGLHLHQPPGNLLALHNSDGRWEAKQILVRRLIVRAYDHLLAAQTSCNFYWGSHWVHRSFDNLEQAYHLLDTARSRMSGA